MAFDRETNVTKTGIEDFEIRLFVPGPNNQDNPQSAIIAVQIALSDGSLSRRRFDLWERLGDDAAGLTHRQNLLALRDYVETRLNNEVLPT